MSLRSLEEREMRSHCTRAGNQLASLGRTFWLFLALLTTACVIASSGPPPPRVRILENDSRRWQYGARAEDVLSHSLLREDVRALFGRDWHANGGRKLSAGAPEFFSKSFPVQVLRIGAWDYIAAAGCLPSACQTHRGVLLIKMDGEELLARLDAGGFSHYYGFGLTVAMPRDGVVVDAAWRALDLASR